MKTGGSKQYLPLLGKPVLAHTLSAFESCPAVNNVILVVNRRDLKFCQEEVVERYGFKKVLKVAEGGKERQDSVYNGLCKVPSTATVTLVHDGARPLITPEIVSEAVSSLDGFDGVVVGIPVKDTVKVVQNGDIEKTFSREKLWCAQTPQIFNSSILLEAYKRAREDNFYGTDDSMLLERLGYRIKMVMGSYDNIKITTQEDLIIAEEIMRRREQIN